MNGLPDVSAPVDAMGNYSLTASSQGAGLKDFTVKVAINNTVGDAFRSSSTPLPVEIVASETLISEAAFRVRMNEDLVLSGVNGVDSQLQAAWPTATTRSLSKFGVGTVTIPDPNPQQPIKISDRTVPVTYNAQAGATVFDINTGTVNNAAASNWTVNVNASNVVFNSAAQNLAALNIGENGVATIAYTTLPATVPDPPQPIPYKVLHLRHLDIAGTPTAPTGKLDLTNNMLIWNYDASSPAQAKIRNWIKAGRNGTDINPPWNGNGITSSTAGQHTGLRTVGYADNGELPLGAYTVFYGHSVDNTTVLVRYTIAGDFNLDGVVDDQDVTIISGTYAPTEPNPFFALGDADYSGFVDDADVTLINGTYDPFWDLDLHAMTQTDG